ncbi:MAG: biotin transporter BioY [Ruminococcus sp.]|nr:biotin transporter BioY [Ruminococcus sp.]
MSGSINKKSKLTLQDMTKIAVCAALLCVSAFLIIPVPFLSVPFTLQVLSVILVALILKPAHSILAALIYTLLGIVGLPVFSGGKGGFGVILSPTGGFIIGFVIAAFFVSLAKGKSGSLPRFIISSILIGIPCIYIPGIAMYMAYTSADLLTAVTALTSVFILVDIVKCVIASFLAVLLRTALSKANLS